MLATNPRAVVTGAGSGLGRAFCLELAARGARILAADVNLASAEATVAMLGGADAHALRCDVAQAAEVEALAAEADRRFGGSDLIVNNAGVAVGGQVGEIPLADWSWILGVNLWGVIHGCHAFVPRFKRQHGGHIINIASAAGLCCLPQMAPYNVTKAGVVALSETLFGELRADNIGVSVVCPTFFQTNIAQASRCPDPSMKAMAQGAMDQSKLSANDVARLALDAATANELYVLPHRDGRWLWRIKRLMPGQFHTLAPSLMAWQARRMGFAPES